MRILLDTHCLLWWRLEPHRVAARAHQLLASPDSELLWSAASTWEIAIKVSIQKLSLPEPVEQYVPRLIAEEQLTPLEISHRHAAAVAALPWHHRDPFDRLLVAQALEHGVPLLSADPLLSPYPVTVLWD